MVAGEIIERPRERPIRRRVAAVALSVMLFALVAVWSGAEIDVRRAPGRAPRPRRGRPPLRTPVVACETLVRGVRAYELDFAACPPSPRSLRRFRPEPPKPWDLN